MMLFRDFFAAATAAATMLMGMTFVVMVMPAAAAMFMGVAFVVVVMSAAATVFVRMTFVVVVMSAATAVFVGVAFVIVVMPAFAAMIVGVAFMAMVMTTGAAVIEGMAFVFVVMPTAATVRFFLFLVVCMLFVCMLFGAMDGFLCLLAVAASAVMYVLFIVFFHGISPYLEWKRCFLSGMILWCYFSILQMHRKWSMRNTLIFQVGQGETIGLDRAKKEWVREGE